MKLSLKNQNILLLNLKNMIIKCTLWPFFVFSPLWKACRHPWQLPAVQWDKSQAALLEFREHSTLTASRHSLACCLRQADPSDALRQIISSISYRICRRNISAIVVASWDTKSCTRINQGQFGQHWRSSQSSSGLSMCRNTHKTSGCHHITARTFLSPLYDHWNWLIIHHTPAE